MVCRLGGLDVVNYQQLIFDVWDDSFVVDKDAICIISMYFLSMRTYADALCTNISKHCHAMFLNIDPKYCEHIFVFVYVSYHIYSSRHIRLQNLYT